MANITDEERKKKLLAKLPSDGSSIGNRSLAEALDWTLPRYFKIRDELALEKEILVGRGRGGSVRLATPKKQKPKQTKKTIKKKKKKNTKKQRERTLYPGFLASLETWADAQGWTNRIVQQTSDQGRRNTGGRFTRADFVVIGIKKYEYTPGVVRDVETFEVKPLGVQIDAVFEAAAHSRAATKSYLAIQVADNQPTEDYLARLEAECQRFGIGLITFKSAKRYKEWQYLVDPIRAEPDPELLDQFIRGQISTKNQEKIRKWW